MDTILSYVNFYIYVILMMIGMWAMIAKNNLIKKLVGMSIFQTAIILFFVSLGAKEGATIPILEYHGGNGKVAHEINPDHYENPLPHVLMLTAIVVGVATLGVGLAIAQHVFHDFNSLEENEILDKIRIEHG